MTRTPLIVTHSLSFNGIGVEAATAALAALGGGADIDAESRGTRLIIHYDLHRLRLDDIEKAMVRAGGQPAGGVFEKVRRSWIRFTDDNRLNNAEAPSHGCCNRPPGGK